jgi:hypothetical protein
MPDTVFGFLLSVCFVFSVEKEEGEEEKEGFGKVWHITALYQVFLPMTLTCKVTSHHLNSSRYLIW